MYVSMYFSPFVSQYILLIRAGYCWIQHFALVLRYTIVFVYFKHPSLQVITPYHSFGVLRRLPTHGLDLPLISRGCCFHSDADSILDAVSPVWCLHSACDYVQNAAGFNRSQIFILGNYAYQYTHRPTSFNVISQGVVQT